MRKVNTLAEIFVPAPLKGLAPGRTVEDQMTSEAAMDDGSSTTIGADAAQALQPFVGWFVLVRIGQIQNGISGRSSQC